MTAYKRIFLSIVAVVVGVHLSYQAPVRGDGPSGMTRAIRPGPNAVRYVIDPRRSSFMANVGSGGLLWFMGHPHHMAVRDFKGEARVTPGTIEPASLALEVKAESLEETGGNFTDEQKKIINNTMRKQVLEVAEHPQITLKGTDVKVEEKTDTGYKVKIGGDLALHGVTRHVVIPAHISLTNGTLKATGEFSINRSDYRIKTHSIKWGMIRVRNQIRFSFDILATRA